MAKAQKPRSQTKQQRVTQAGAKPQQARPPAAAAAAAPSSPPKPPEPPRTMSKDLFVKPPLAPAPYPPVAPKAPDLKSGRAAINAGMERTLGERVDGAGSGERVNIGAPPPRGEFTPSNKTLGDRAREAKGLGPMPPNQVPLTGGMAAGLGASVDAAALRHAASISTDLHTRGEGGDRIPTLAERVAHEGVKAQLSRKK